MAGDKLVSGGMDRRIQIHTVPADPTASQHLDYSFEYHQAPISSLRASPHSASNFLSSSWDGALALWSIDAAYETKDASSSQASGPSSKKRRKTAQDGSTFPSKALRPQQVLINNDSANGSTIHRALFDRAHQNRAWSASADHSVKCWDLEHGLSTQSRVSSFTPVTWPKLTPLSLNSGRPVTRFFWILIRWLVALTSSSPAAQIVLFASGTSVKVRVWFKTEV